MSRSVELQRLIRLYREETGESALDMSAVAIWLERRGIRMPSVPTPRALLERELRRAAREEHRYDSKGRPYRAYHAISESTAGQQRWWWFDIDDDVPKQRMEKSLNQRREQMVGDAVALVRDADHWNDLHPDQEPIQTTLDFGPDVLWAKAAQDEHEAG